MDKTPHPVQPDSLLWGMAYPIIQVAFPSNQAQLEANLMLYVM